jgi:hypothetical protein
MVMGCLGVERRLETISFFWSFFFLNLNCIRNFFPHEFVCQVLKDSILRSFGRRRKFRSTRSRR